MIQKWMVGLVLLSLLLAACGGDSSSSATGGSAASRGEELIKQTTIGSNAAPGCTTCHSLEEDIVLVGPSLAGIGSRAGQAVSGKSAEEYLREAIIAPDAHVLPDYAPGLMYQKYGEDLTDQQINDLVAYLLTLE